MLDVIRRYVCMGLAISLSFIWLLIYVVEEPKWVTGIHLMIGVTILWTIQCPLMIWWSRRKL